MENLAAKQHMDTFEKTSARTIALDYGERRIGVAVSDELGITAQAQPTITVKDVSDAVKRVGEFIGNYSGVTIVIGLPLGVNGEQGPAADKVKQFGEKLKSYFPDIISVEYFDERFTSKQAERTLREMNIKPSRNKEKVDALSAVFILQGYLALQEAKKAVFYLSNSIE